ncbi:MAG: anthranilate phosphoribosyltransferase, partial [Nocardioidaceae bacterium]|nr:anthranilate phosphoribosyltransferase [Nocardioidaceae bacterium]
MSSLPDTPSESRITWPDVLSSLIAGADLSSAQSGWAMREILAGEATPAQIAGFAVALRAKGETVDEVEGLVATMYDFATPVTFAPRSVDIVGTGGDRSHTVNISTMAALVTAGAGVPVVKHGNRAASSSCGSADVLEHLGVRLDLSPAQVEQVANRVGITFCFAPVFHAALRHAAVPRRELG